jgi:hypothetical protein
MFLRNLFFTVLCAWFVSPCHAEPPRSGGGQNDTPKVMEMRRAVKAQLPSEIRLAPEWLRQKWKTLNVSLSLSARTKISETVLPYLGDAGSYVRSEAAFWLAEMGIVRHLAELEKAYEKESKDDNSETAAQMLYAIWKLKYAACLDDTERSAVLIEVISTQPSPLVYWAVSLAGEHGILKCSTTLESLRKADTLTNRTFVQTALSKIELRTKALTDEAAVALKSENLEIRRWGMQTIGANRLQGNKDALVVVAQQFEEKYKNNIQKGPWPSPAEISDYRLCLWALKELNCLREDFTGQFRMRE